MSPTKKAETKKTKAPAKKPVTAKTPKKTPAEEIPIIAFAQPRDWADWLTSHHASSRGVWLKLAKKASGVASVTYAEALGDMAKGCAARLAGVESPSFPDTETTFPELQARIAKTLTFLQSVTAAQIDGSEERDITLKMGGRETQFKGQTYLLSFVLPNFYFHLTTAYAILRHNGLEIGKQDFLGAR
jgi:hypothetical protein